MIVLKNEMQNLLIDCIKKHDRSLLWVTENHSREISISIYNRIRDIIGNELIQNGLKENWEPNEYGLKLEALIDEIGKLYL